jgi:uncharacterized protein with HEPN domain
MPPDEANKFLFDARQACISIQQFVQGKSLVDYDNDALLRSAIERQFIIVGEALLQASKHGQPLDGNITDARRIVAFRNVLVHGYAAVNNQIVWDVIEKNLPTLVRELDTLLTKAPSK